MDEKSKEKEYTFVQETIRPKKKSRVKKMAFTISMAVVFGVVSCIVFCLCLPLFSDYFKLDSKQIIIGKGDELKNASSVLSSPQTAVTTDTKTMLPTVAPTTKPEKTKTPDKDGESALLGISSEKVQRICKKVNQSVVKVDNMKDSYDVFGSGNTEDTGATCGIVVAKSDHQLLIYVNKARIDESENVFVTFEDNKMVQASVYGKHEELGILILSVELSQFTKEELDTIEVADFNLADELEIGEAVMALGNPNRHLYSFAYGYVSNAPYNAYIVDNAITLINTTIDFNTKGDGVLVNTSGEIVGFITHMPGFTSELNYDVNTCYSIRSLEPIITKLVNKTTDIYFGIRASEITSEIAYKTNVSTGIYITGVENNSPAFYADLKKGDIITAIDDETVTSASQFNTIINRYKENEKVFVTYLRTVNGKQVKKKVSVEVSIVK